MSISFARIKLEKERSLTSRKASLPTRVLAPRGPLLFYVHFGNNLTNFMKKAHWDVDWNCPEFTDHLFIPFNNILHFCP